MPSIGVYLKNSNVEYDLRRSGPQTFVVDADFGMTPDDTVRDYLIYMAPLHPIFGFGAHRRNWNTEIALPRHLASMSWEAGSGVILRNISQACIGGPCCRLRWPEQHGVSLSVLMQAAQEHIELEGQQHLLRFYKKPEDWRSAASSMAELYHSCPGIFDVEKLPPKLQGKTNFLEIHPRHSPRVDVIAAQGPEVSRKREVARRESNAPRLLPPAEQALDVGELQFDVGRAAVVALAGMGRRFHLAQQGVHLGA